MKRISTATGLLTLVAMAVLGVFSVGSASAHSFLWTGPLPGLVLVLSDNPQVFTVEPKGLAVTCKHFGGEGIASNGKGMSVKVITVTGKYSKCEATGGFVAQVSDAEYELSAEESVAVSGKPIVITFPALGCSLKINNGAPNNNLSKIRFLNEGSNILAHVEIAGITSLASGEPCGPAGVEKPNGEYTGLLRASLDGGTIKWD
jgi:hypothetical protein